MLGGQGGYCISGGDSRIFVANPCVGRRVFCAGAEKMNWAYVLSGGLALALLVYLVVALIRAEDL
jgi:K+-transporting ATPase KdpF subunit